MTNNQFNERIKEEDLLAPKVFYQMHPILQQL